MRLVCTYSPVLILYLTAWTTLKAAAPADANQTWNQLRLKRESLKAFHQEFEVSRTFKTQQHTQASKFFLSLDAGSGRWREKSVSGAGNYITIFDGKDLFQFEDGGEEYERLKRSPKEPLPQSSPYSTMNLDFSKAVERDRRSCGLTNVDHECVTIDIPVKPWMHVSGNKLIKALGGTTRMFLDTVTGLVISSRTMETIDDSRGGYQSDTLYLLKRMSYNGDADESLFRIPPGVKEVRELSRWNADRMKKQLAGKAAPDLVLTDLQGETVRLSDLKGKTVLLDFWATWCGPCRADGPSLDKLYQKYHQKNLTIVGVSVDEDRAVVKKFLSEHPHQYAIALTTENEIPRPYQIGVFPTYIVIDPEGNLAAATEGDTGFAELRKLLKKAGLETD
jgi:thiol-disulfide isomerase/thioredoxin